MPRVDELVLMVRISQDGVALREQAGDTVERIYSDLIAASKKAKLGNKKRPKNFPDR